MRLGLATRSTWPPKAAPRRRLTCQTGPVVANSAPVRLLTRTQVRSLVRWPALIEATTQALIDAASGESAVAAASQLHVPGAALHLKSGALAEPPVLTVKANLRPASGGAAGLIVAFDPVAGTVRGVLDSADITAMRTGAIAAVAARQLAGPGPHTLAVLGAGPSPGRPSPHCRRSWTLARYAYGAGTAPAAAQFSLTKTPPVTPSSSPGQAVAGAGIVLTATPSRQPLLTGADLGGTPWCWPWARTRGASGNWATACWTTPSWSPTCPAEAAVVGELAYLPGGADPSRCLALGDLLAGRRTLPRPALPRPGLPRDRRIVFDSVGTAVVDAAAVAIVLDAAERAGVGALVDFAR